MRMMVKASLPTDIANAALLNGSFTATLQKILGEIRPEAVYFITNDDGERTALIFLDMKESSQIPAIAEPFFQALNAKVTMRPCMSAQDLAAAGPALDGAKHYGKRG